MDNYSCPWTAPAAAQLVGYADANTEHFPLLDALGVVQAAGGGQPLEQVLEQCSAAAAPSLPARFAASLAASLLRALAVTTSFGVGLLSLTPRYLFAIDPVNVKDNDDGMDEDGGPYAPKLKLDQAFIATRLSVAHCTNSAPTAALAEILPEARAVLLALAEEDVPLETARKRIARAIDPVALAAATIASGGSIVGGGLNALVKAPFDPARFDRACVGLTLLSTAFAPQVYEGAGSQDGDGDLLGYVIEPLLTLAQCTEGQAGREAMADALCGGGGGARGWPASAAHAFIELVAELLRPEGGRAAAALLDAPFFELCLGGGGGDGDGDSASAALSGQAVGFAADAAARAAQARAARLWRARVDAAAEAAVDAAVSAASLDEARAVASAAAAGLLESVACEQLPRLASLGVGGFGALYKVRLPLRVASAWPAEQEGHELPFTAEPDLYALKCVLFENQAGRAATLAAFCRECETLDEAARAAPVNGRPAASVMVAAGGATLARARGRAPWRQLLGAELLPTELFFLLKLYKGGSADDHEDQAFNEVINASIDLAAAEEAERAAAQFARAARKAALVGDDVARGRPSGSGAPLLANLTNLVARRAEARAARAARRVAARKAVLRAKGRKQVRWALASLYAALSSLAALHRAGYASLDLKPPNVLFERGYFDGEEAYEDEEGARAVASAAARSDSEDEEEDDEDEDDEDEDDEDEDEDEDEDGAGGGGPPPPPAVRPAICARPLAPCVVADLGMAVRLDRSDPSRTDADWLASQPHPVAVGGSPRFISPEVYAAIAGTGPRGQGAPADVFAAGVMLVDWTMRVNHACVEIRTDRKAVVPAAEGVRSAARGFCQDYRPLDGLAAMRARGLIIEEATPCAAAGPFADLAARMLHADPTMRITAAEALEHPLFTRPGAEEQLLDFLGLSEQAAAPDGPMPWGTGIFNAWHCPPGEGQMAWLHATWRLGDDGRPLPSAASEPECAYEPEPAPAPAWVFVEAASMSSGASSSALASATAAAPAPASLSAAAAEAALIMPARAQVGLCEGGPAMDVGPEEGFVPVVVAARALDPRLAPPPGFGGAAANVGGPPPGFGGASHAAAGPPPGFGATAYLAAGPPPGFGGAATAAEGEAEEGGDDDDDALFFWPEAAPALLQQQDALAPALLQQQDALAPAAAALSAPVPQQQEQQQPLLLLLPADLGSACGCADGGGASLAGAPAVADANNDNADAADDDDATPPSASPPTPACGGDPAPPAVQEQDEGSPHDPYGELAALALASSALVQARARGLGGAGGKGAARARTRLLERAAAGGAAAAAAKGLERAGSSLPGTPVRGDQDMLHPSEVSSLTSSPGSYCGAGGGAGAGSSFSLGSGGSDNDNDNDSGTLPLLDLLPLDQDSVFAPPAPPAMADDARLPSILGSSAVVVVAAAADEAEDEEKEEEEDDEGEPPSEGAGAGAEEAAAAATTPDGAPAEPEPEPEEEEKEEPLQKQETEGLALGASSSLSRSSRATDTPPALASPPPPADAADASLPSLLSPSSSSLPPTPSSLALGLAGALFAQARLLARAVQRRGLRPVVVEVLLQLVPAA